MRISSILPPAFAISTTRYIATTSVTARNTPRFARCLQTPIIVDITRRALNLSAELPGLNDRPSSSQHPPTAPARNAIGWQAFGGCPNLLYLGAHEPQSTWPRMGGTRGHQGRLGG